MRLDIVDVFAESPLAGNQLAVVHDAGALSTERMQAIALEMNYSETTFIISQHADRARVRIFTPTFELPFAGHPTLGTAWVLVCGSGATSGAVTLELDAGDVPVTFDDGMGWMVPPDVKFQGAFDPQTATELLGLPPTALHSELPVELLQVGPAFLFVPLADLAALKAARLNSERHNQLLTAGHAVQAVFLFTDEAYSSDADIAARMFFQTGGVREDPATGSANAAFAAYLRKHRGNVGRVVVDQGVEINRASRLYLDVADNLRVGGKVQPVLTGKLAEGVL